MSIEALDSDLLEDRLGATVFDLPSSDLSRRVEIIGERDGGLIDCWVPTELIDHEEVPVKEEWALSLALQMQEMSKAGGGTGQLSPILLGLIEGENTLKIADGFHRDAALELNDEPMRYATIKLTDWDGLYDVRIFTAKDHAHVRFSRVVQWIREIWQRTGQSDVMTVEQAVLLYQFDTDGSRLGLEPDAVAAAKAWIARKEEQWQMAAMTIHGHLKIAEHVDPQLVHSTREKRGGHALEAPTVAILKIFSNYLPNRFDLQNLVMDIAMQRNLRGPQVKALSLHVAPCRNLEEARITVGLIDLDSLQPEYHESTKRALRRAYDPRHKGGAVLNRASQDVANVIERVSLSLEREEEVTSGMRELLREALDRTQSLQADMGTLVVKLTDLIEQKNNSAEPEVEEEESVETPPSPPPVQPRPAPQPRARETRPESRPTPPATRSVIEPRAPSPERSAKTTVAPRQPSPSAPPAAHRTEGRHVEGESEMATRFKQQLLDYLNGRSDELPRFINRSHIIWAEAVLAKGTFSGHPNLIDDVHDMIDTARRKTSEKVDTWTAAHSRGRRKL